MNEPSPGSVTRFLIAWRGGDERALERLIPVVYGELRRLAGRYLNRERASHTLETHDLIHEAFLRLVDQRQVDWRNRAHFFAIAAQMMRRILVDHARRRGYRKHGGGLRQLALDEVPDPAAQRDMDLVALDEALAELAQVDGELAKVVDLRFFGGLEHTEIAAALGVSNPTVRRRWRVAKAWLYRRLAGERSHGG
ncbi:MAG TPA: sigma-70 family RNA polymerase sigma factor [Thermoanaerobaculia bacterium]|nr:sigma-70 family RNA polymerase sigma factor [Thermoanaerobaculia bacterium]